MFMLCIWTNVRKKDLLLLLLLLLLNNSLPGYFASYKTVIQPLTTRYPLRNIQSKA